MIRLSPVVRQKAAQLGDPGQRWLAGLPDLVGGLCRDWSITVGAQLPGGSASYVARVRTADGGAAVLKLAVPDPGFADQVRTLAAAGGRGYARLLAHDVARHAVLLEALDAPMDRLALPPLRAIRLLSRVLRQAWQVPRWPGLVATPARQKAVGLHELVNRLWRQLDRPCPARVVAHALRCAEQRAAAFDPDRCVVVHGDPHPGNALRVTRRRPGAECGFVFVDPDGFLADPAYDLGVALRDWCPQLLHSPHPARLARRYCAALAAGTGVDETAIWQWGYLERVSTGLFILQFGAHRLARPFLATAELLLPERRRTGGNHG